MYRTGLMPPRLAMLGVIGGPLIFVSAIAVLFGVYVQPRGAAGGEVARLAADGFPHPLLRRSRSAFAGWLGVGARDEPCNPHRTPIRRAGPWHDADRPQHAP